MPSYITVRYPEHELGVWQVGPGDTIPNEASWAVASSPEYGEVNLLENPSFEFETLGWMLGTPPDKKPLDINVRDSGEDKFKCAVMVSDEMGYRGGLSQGFGFPSFTVLPNTTFHVRVRIKTTDIDNLKILPLYVDVYDAERNWYGSDLNAVCGSEEWTLYEREFTTPDKPTTVAFYPALVYNKGDVWINDTCLTMTPNPITATTILNWIDLRLEATGLLPFRTATQIEKTENWLRKIPTENFWGIIFIAEEIYKTDIQFNDDVNATWFSEKLLGYPQYLAQNLNATEDEWRDEMYLRMIRGFYDCFHVLTKVGITLGCNALMPTYQEEYYGEPAFEFIKEHYDFAIFYFYTTNLEDFKQTKAYFSVVDTEFSRQKKFWIITQFWEYSKETWERESIALEMKNALDRGMVMMTYYSSPMPEQWADMLRCVELYNNNQPYYESLTYGKNLLTGVVGNTYGYVGY
jgi:hypothetical protein